MKLRTLLVIGFGFIVAGCAEKAPPAADEAAPMDDTAAMKEAVVEEATAAADAAITAAALTRAGANPSARQAAHSRLPAHGVGHFRSAASVNP